MEACASSNKIGFWRENVIWDVRSSSVYLRYVAVGILCCVVVLVYECGVVAASLLAVADFGEADG